MKKQMEEENLSQDSTDIWTLNIIDKYEKREEDLDNICLADFASSYSWSTKLKKHALRKQPRIIRFINYSMIDNLSEYQREMVTLFYPFRNEHIDITDHMKYLNIFNENIMSIMQNYEKYAKLDIHKCIAEFKIINQALQENGEAVNVRQENFVTRPGTMEVNNDDINNINTNMMTAVVRQRLNVMSAADFCCLMRKTNTQQREFLLTFLNALTTETPFQVFFTGSAGTGKTFTLNLLREIANRFGQTHITSTNAYVACASTGKAAVAIGGTTVHSAFRIAISRRKSTTLSRESIQAYRNAFAHVKVIIIDEISMIGAEILQTIESRMRKISGNSDEVFGGLSVVFCGDLRQLSPVNARSIYKPPKDSISGAILWQSLKYYSLTQVMRQTDVMFSTILTKIGNGINLTVEETNVLKTRFRTVQWCSENCPNAVRLFHINTEVDKYNIEILTSNEACITSICTDIITGYKNNDELVASKTKLYKMSVTECAGLPYILKILIGKPYIINTNIDVEDGLVNGAIGYVKYVENDEEDQNQMKRVWIDFENDAIGQNLRIKSKPLVASKPGILRYNWTPITKRNAVISLTRTVKCKRIHFPISPACALTIHKSQGGTFNEIVFNYNKSQDQQLVYVALSRVTSINGLFLTNKENNYKFYHCKTNNSPKMIELRSELQRLNSYKLQTIYHEVKQYLANKSFSIASLNIQSLRAHHADLELDEVLTSTNIILLNETWVNNDEIIPINGFRSIVQFKLPNRRAGGVCIFENTNSFTQTVPHIFVRADSLHQTFQIFDDIGDICAAKTKINNQTVLLISVYIKCNMSIDNIQLFLSSHLTSYSKNIHLISPILASEGYHKLPIILAGDFNIDFKKPENTKLINSIKEQFDLFIIIMSMDNKFLTD